MISHHISHKITKSSYLIHITSDPKNKDTLLSSTLKVGENKVHLFSWSEVNLAIYGPFVVTILGGPQVIPWWPVGDPQVTLGGPQGDTRVTPGDPGATWRPPVGKPGTPWIIRGRPESPGVTQGCLGSPGVTRSHQWSPWRHLGATWDHPGAIKGPPRGQPESHGVTLGSARVTPG